MPGGGTDVSVYAYPYDWGSKEYFSPHGSTLRMVVDWGGESSLTLENGQSGHFLSPHYEDFLKENLLCKFVKWEQHITPVGRTTTINPY